MTFQKFSGGDTSGPSQWEGTTPSGTQHPLRPLAGRGALAPRCRDPNIGPSQLFSRGCAHAICYQTANSHSLKSAYS